LNCGKSCASHATASNFDEPDRSGICDLPCRSLKGHSRRVRDVGGWSALPPGRNRHLDRPRRKSAMYGRRPCCKRNLTFQRSVRVQPCIRPLNAAALAAGPDVIR
jgi:hypothetical protein